MMLKARWNARQHAGDTQVPASTRVLAIASGKGGVGKSSVTVNLAVALARQGRTVGVLDADIWGFSIPRLLGMSERLEARQGRVQRPRADPCPTSWPSATGRLKVVSTGFLVGEDTALMWRGLMLTKAVEQFLRDVQWGELDDLLIDMPPGTGDVQMGLSRLLPRADMVIVTTPALAAQKVAQRAADMARRSFVRVVGVIENMSVVHVRARRAPRAVRGRRRARRWPTQIDVPLLGQIPLEPAVVRGGDEGRPVALVRRSGGRGSPPIAARLDDVVPPHGTADVDMSGCTARLLAAVGVALEATAELRHPSAGRLSVARSDTRGALRHSGWAGGVA